MKLEGKKELASRALGIGKKRIVFNKERISEIKEAITKQDIRDLLKDKAIFINEIKGRKKIVRRKTRRRAGSVKKKVNNRKRDYMNITRKLRSHLKLLKDKKRFDNESYRKLRKEVRARQFKSKASLKERIARMENKNEENI